MKRTELKRKTGLKRTQLQRKATVKRRRTTRRAGDRTARDVFREAAREQGVCQVSGMRGAWQAHHVIEAQELRRRGVDEFDPRNALRVSPRVHERHTLAVQRIPMRCLTEANIEYAFELMGTGAYGYFCRYYGGHDERVELALAELENAD